MKHSIFRKIVFIFHKTSVKVVAAVLLFSTSAAIITAVFLGNEAGTFVVRVQNTDSTRSIALTESMDADKYELLPRLNAKGKDQMTDTSPRYFLDADYKTIRENFYNSGDGEVDKDITTYEVYAYRFYLVNNGESTVGVDTTMKYSNVTRKIDDILRVMTYYEYNGNQVAHIYQKVDQEFVEYEHYNVGSVELFSDEGEIFNISGDDKIILDFAEGRNYLKYLVLIWLEGDDPDSSNYMLGGSVSFNLEFKVSM